VSLSSLSSAADAAEPAKRLLHTPYAIPAVCP